VHTISRNAAKNTTTFHRWPKKEKPMKTWGLPHPTPLRILWCPEKKITFHDTLSTPDFGSSGKCLAKDLSS